jgi:2-C-methyl-D-erythritol 2,4-cyclodiphosphate synthase
VVYKDQAEQWLYISAIGQDSHRFMSEEEAAARPDRQLVLAGVSLPGQRPLAGNSDADVILHALTNAVSGLTGKNILGARADYLCLEKGITDSSVYLAEALADLAAAAGELLHISVAVEAKRPHLAAVIPDLRQSLASLTGLGLANIGLTATSGEGLTGFGKGEGIQVFCQVSARRRP